MEYKVWKLEIFDTDTQIMTKFFLIMQPTIKEFYHTCKSNLKEICHS